MQKHMKAQWKNWRSHFENVLECEISAAAKAPGGIGQIMEYSLMAGGKRIRPFLTALVSSLFNGDPVMAEKFGCGLEMIHTYSLIHDDLPCMDNDDLRRGKPTCHKKFGECNALLAGDALLTHAFSLFTDTVIPAECAAAAVRYAAQEAGFAGMIGGQMLDLAAQNSNTSPAQLAALQDLKTGALLRLSGALGCISAGILSQDDTRMQAVLTYCSQIGAAFQIMDDVLDACSTTDRLGKQIGSDLYNEKVTYLSFYTPQQARELAAAHTEAAITAITPYDRDNSLAALAALLCTRDR